MASRRLAALELSEDERVELRSLAVRRNTAQALALRARIVLACAAGAQNKTVAAQLHLDPATVGKWRGRFDERRLDGLRDEPRSGAPRTIEDARIEAVIVRTLESLPPEATHKTPLIHDWLAKRPRWHVHLTPTRSSRLNQVERFFALLTERQIRRGVHRSIDALQAAIADFIERHNADPKPFRWTKSADDILASIERFCLHNAPAKA